MLPLLTDMSFSILFPTEWRSFLCLNYLTFGTVHCRASGSRRELGTQLRHSDSGWWQKPGENAVEKRLPASTPGMTGAVVEGAWDPRGGAEERGIASWRRIPLRHIWQNWNIHMPAQNRRFSVCRCSQSLFSFGGVGYWLVCFILHIMANPPGDADSSRVKTGMFQML